MLWLYFVRDFYRASNSHTSALHATARTTPSSTISARTATVAFQPEVHAATQHAPKAQPQTQVQPDTQPALAHYLQRLSVDGEHAFGVWDEQAGFSMFSANFERVTCLSAGECAGHDWIHTIHHHQQYNVNEALLAASQGHDGRCLVQARSLHDGENWRWLMIDIKAATARQPSVMVLFRDLTEQKALELALQETESALALSERGRSAFLSSMSHELRTPLNAIMGFSEMMTNKVFGELGNKIYSEYAKHIHDSGNTLLGKINDLLDIASMDAGGLALEEAPTSLSHLLAEVVEMHSHTAFMRQQQLKLDCPFPIQLHADRAKLICAISHLVTNALRHSGDGSEITLSVRVQADDGVIVSVRDAGEGIPAAQLSTILNALSSEDTYYNIECGGIGLGLSLAKELTQRHGGRVMIDSIRHRGTVVSLILPMSRVLSGAPQKKRRDGSRVLELVN